MIFALLLLVGCTSPHTNYQILDLQDRVEFLESENRKLRSEHFGIKETQDDLTNRLNGCLTTLNRIDEHYEAIRDELGDR